MWDVNVVLKFFLEWQDNDFQSLKQLSAKLTMLLCLISIKRIYDVRALDVSSIQYAASGVCLRINKRTKTNLSSVHYPYFPHNIIVCW